MLFSGSAAGQLVNLLSYPLLARLYSPSDFGGFAIFVAASAIPAAIACARFDLAIPTAPRHGRFAIVWLSYSAGIVIASAAGILGAAYWLSMGAHGALLLAVLLAFAVAITGFCNATNLFLMRHDRYRLTSVSVFTRTAAAVAAQLLFALVLRNSWGLILGYCLGLLCQAAMLVPSLARVMGRKRPRVRQMRAMVARYGRQVTADIPGTLVGAWALFAAPFIIQLLYGPSAVGFYSVGQRMAVIPLQLFNDSLSQIFFQKAARAQQERGTFWRETKFNLLVSAVLSFGILVPLVLLARPLIKIYLGAQWAPTATILIILAPMLAVRSLTMSIATTVYVIQKAHWLMLHNVATMVILVVSLGAAYATGASLETFLTILSVLSAIEYAVFGGLLVRAARTQPRRAGQLA